MKMDNNKYEENFLFRKRSHTIIEEGIKTEQNGFFNSSVIVTKFDQIGSIVQYKSELRLSEVLTSIVFLILGIKGLSNSAADSVLFAISISLIAIAFYWLIIILFNLKYIGSFYFSDSIHKDKNVFEIKSKYPPKKALQDFLSKITELKKEADINYFIERVSDDITNEDLNAELRYIKRKYLLEEDEIQKIRARIIDNQNTGFSKE